MIIEILESIRVRMTDLVGQGCLVVVLVALNNETIHIHNRVHLCGGQVTGGST